MINHSPINPQIYTKRFQLASYLYNRRDQKEQNNNKIKKKQFIPFIQERDTMGRLIKNNKHDYDLNLNDKRLSVYNISNFDMSQSIKAYSPDKQRQIKEDKINLRFFKQKTRVLSGDDKNLAKLRQRSTQKKIITYLSIDQGCQRPKNNFTIQQQLGKSIIKLKKDPYPQMSKTAQIHRTEQSPRKKYKNNTSLSWRKSKSQKKILPQSSYSKNDKKQASPSIKHISLKQIADCPQLQRFKQMQKLSIKIISNFQQSHKKFLDKIINAKRMAINIQRQLQA